MALLDELGALGPRFTAVHATHLAPHEIELLARAPSFVCLCRTTERDLGDGLPPTAELVRRGVRLSLGADSHAITDPFEEARAVELDERTRTETRCAGAEASALLAASTREGYASIGQTDRGDRVVLDATSPELVGADEAQLDDAVIFAASPRSVREVWVAGARIVERAMHVRYSEARAGFEAALKRLL